MRRLILMRHAKSAWNTAAANDHARPLNPRGRRDAPRIGRAIADLGWRPDRVLSSDSTRTRETLDGMHEALGDVPVAFSRDLYHGDLDAIRVAVAEVDAAVGTVLVLGHNPGWEDAASVLTGESIAMTTANAALMDLDAPDWPAAIHADGHWALRAFLRPKALRD